MGSPLKVALEDLLRHRRLIAEAPPLRGEDCRLRPLTTGIPDVDGLLGGGFPRGQVSEVHGPRSSGRTGLVLSLLARCTRAAGAAAWVDPADRFDPASASEAGLDLARLLWVRGEAYSSPRSLMRAVSALSALLGSGLFEVVVLDVAGLGSAEMGRLPGATWIRLQRMIESLPTALVLLAEGHVAHGPGGASLALQPAGPRWAGPPGPGRLLGGLAASVRCGRPLTCTASFELRALA